ncbi:MAG: hypothetical protein KDK60_02505 [Chlamydiia bacterium]|nr:hypothetical protein [Chlamydiia bacterium]
MSGTAHQTSGERLLNQALQSQGNARAQFAKPVNIGGKAYYMVVLQGGEFKNLQYDHVPTEKIHEVAKTLFSAHKNASDIKTREIDYIDTRGVHYRDRSFTSHDAAALTNKGKNFTHKQLLDSIKPIAKFSEQLEKVPNPTDRIEWKIIPKSMQSALKESNLKQLSYTKQELQQLTLNYAKHQVTKYGEQFAKDLSPEMARKLTLTLDWVITEARDMKDLLTKTYRAIDKCSTARASWNAMKKILISSQTFLIPAEIKYSRTQSFDLSQYEVFSNSGTDEEFSVSSGVSGEWSYEPKFSTSVDPLPLYQSSEKIETDNGNHFKIQTINPNSNNPSNEINFGWNQVHPSNSFNKSSEEDNLLNCSFSETLIKEKVEEPIELQTINPSNNALEDSHHDDESLNTSNSFTSLTSSTGLLSLQKGENPLELQTIINETNSTPKTHNNSSFENFEDEPLNNSQQTSITPVLVQNKSIEEKKKDTVQIYMWNPQKAKSGKKQRRVEKDKGEKYRDIMRFAKKAETLKSIEGFKDIAQSALKKLTGKENIAFTNKELQVIKFAQQENSSMYWYVGVARDEDKWTSLLYRLEKFSNN